LKKNILIIGSNFSRTYHLKIIKKIYKETKIYICSPNINKKKINKEIIKCEDYQLLIKKKKFFLILCCATSEVQTCFIKFLLLEKIKPRNIILEKPVSNNLLELEKFFTYCEKNQINLSINYTYANLKIISKIKEIFIKNKSQSFLEFNLKFKHPFYLKKNNSWKNFISMGGGIINYYVNHILYSCILIFGKIKIKSLKIIHNKNQELKEFILNLYGNKISIRINININSNEYEHKYNFFTNKKKFTFLTRKKNWYDKYEVYINDSFKKEYTENILQLIKKNYSYLNKKISKKKEYLNKILMNEKLCINLNKRLIKYDFKKM